MVQGVCFFDAVLVLLLCSVTGLLLMDPRKDMEDDQELNKAILEMLHINKVSASHLAKPHPYMKRIYQRLDSLEAQDFGSSDGTLVQSYRSVSGKELEETLLKNNIYSVFCFLSKVQATLLKPMNG